MDTAIPTDIVDGRITVNLALLMLADEGLTIGRHTLYRELRRRGVPLYRVGSTLTFAPSFVTDLIRDKRGR